MAAMKGRYTRIFLDEWDISAASMNVDIETAVTSEDATTFQADGREVVAMTASTKIVIKGFFVTADGDGDLENEFQASLDTPVTLGVMLAESTADAGAPVYVLVGTSPENIKIGAPAAGLLTVDGTFTDGTTGKRRGLLLWRGAITTTGTKTAIDTGAAGAAGGDVYVFVQSITGTATDAAIAVESATTQGGSYSTEATQQFSAVGAFAAAMTGTVNRWLIINTTSMGGATAFTVAVVACVDGVTQN